MPLITCPGCGKRHSDAALACPECGRPNPTLTVPSSSLRPAVAPGRGAATSPGERKKVGSTGWLVFLGVIVLAAGLMMTSNAKKKPNTPSARHAEGENATPARVLSDSERAVVAGRALAAKWSYYTKPDAMTGKMARYASISSENSVDFDFPYQGP